MKNIFIILIAINNLRKYSLDNHKKNNIQFINYLIIFGAFYFNCSWILRFKFGILHLLEGKNIKGEFVINFIELWPLCTICSRLLHSCSKTSSRDLSEKLPPAKFNSFIYGKMHFTNIFRLSSFKLQLTEFIYVYIKLIVKDSSIVLFWWI